MKTKFLLLPIVLNFLAIALHSQNVEPPVRKGIDPANGAEIAIKRSNDVGQIANILHDTAVRQRNLPRILQRVEKIQPSDGTKEKSKIIQEGDSSLYVSTRLR